MRVLQEAHVDHHVDAARHPALVGEGLQRHRQPAAAPPPRRTAGAISARSSCGVIALVSISTSARSRSRREQRQLALDADRAATRAGSAGAAAGSRCSAAPASRRRSRDRPAPAPARPPPRPRRAPRSSRSTENSRLRGSMPIDHRPLHRPAGEQPRQEAERQVVDRLEAEVLQRADRRRPPGARRSAHDDDVLPLLRASCLGHLCTPCPTHRPCLPHSGKARPFCTKMVNTSQDLGPHARKSTPSRLPGTRLSQAVAFVPRAPGRGRRASASGASGTAGSAQEAEPARLDQPRESPSGARATSASPRRSIADPVVGDQRGAPPDQRAAPAPTCPRPRRRESARPRPANATAEPCTSSVDACPSAVPRRALFPSEQCESNPNADPNILATRAAAAFRRQDAGLTLSHGSKAAPPRVIDREPVDAAPRQRGIGTSSGSGAVGAAAAWRGYAAHDDGVQGAGRGQSADDARGVRAFPAWREAHYNLLEPALVQAAIARGEGELGRGGAFLVSTGRHTGRSPQGQVRRPRALGRGRTSGGRTTPRWRPSLRRLARRHARRTSAAAELFVQDLYAGADPAYRLNVRVITELAWHGLFIRHLLRRPAREELAGFVPGFTILNCPSFQADPARHGCRSETVIAISFEQQLILIGGTAYAGENKKSVFTVLNYLLPEQGVMPMHCSANHAARRPGRRRGLLRPLRHRQDHALGRPRPRPDRRRRARLVRQRHLQLRGRLLRQDHQPLARGRARDLRHHHAASAPSSRTWSGTRSPARSTSPTTA